ARSMGAISLLTGIRQAESRLFAQVDPEKDVYLQWTPREHARAARTNNRDDNRTINRGRIRHNRERTGELRSETGVRRRTPRAATTIAYRGVAVCGLRIRSR